MRVRYVWFASEHHAEHSGYHQIVRYCSEQWSDVRRPTSLAWRVARAALRNRFAHVLITRGLGKLSYGSVDRFLDELQVLPRAMISHREILHFIYGESSYRFTGSIPRLRGSKVLCTFHFPPEMLPEKIRCTRQLSSLDGVILVASNQIDFFAQWVSGNKIFLIPHGVDTDFFRPAPHRPDVGGETTCLLVGSHMRDFATFRKVVQIVNSDEERMRFIVITLPHNFHYLEDMANVTLISGISDEQLCGYYQSSTIGIQPMLDCTANNALLEGMACGLPTVATDVGGIRDYVDEICAVLVPPNDAQLMARRLIELSHNEKRLHDLSTAGRQRALTFNWPEIATRTREVYEKVMSD